MTLRAITAHCSFDDGMEPNILGPFLPIHPEEVAVFNDFLSDEVDSSYTSSLCCCDECYDSFAARWPDTAFRSEVFQRQAIETLFLVDESRIPGVYSSAEMSTLRRLVRCPRCYADGPSLVWIYEHRFSNVDDLETDIGAMLSVGRRTPFLLLEYPLARDVLEAVRARFAGVLPTTLEWPLFRARTTDSVAAAGQSPDQLETYGPAPAKLTAEGRFNHAGVPMIYLADSAQTAASELGCPGDECWVGELGLLKPLRILDLTDVEDEEDLIQALAQSALLSAPHTGEGWIKREYVFSRFVADCAIEAGFDAIRYGSTKKASGANYVLLAPPAETGGLFRLIDHQKRPCPAPDRRF